MMILLIRRKWILGSVVLLLTAATVLSFYAKPPAVAALSYIELPKSEMIILDAGHGGSDGGELRKAASTWPSRSGYRIFLY